MHKATEYAKYKAAQFKIPNQVTGSKLNMPKQVTKFKLNKQHKCKQPSYSYKGKLSCQRQTECQNKLSKGCQRDINKYTKDMQEIWKRRKYTEQS